MSETKFTPGEWKFGIRRDGSKWLSLGDPHRGPHYQCDLAASDADARLIVTARELYAALDAIVTSLAAQDDEGLIEHAEPMKSARAALAKARGATA